MVLSCPPQRPFFFFSFSFCITFMVLCGVHESGHAALADNQRSCIPLAESDATILAQLKSDVVDPRGRLSSWQYHSNFSAACSTASSAAASSINSYSSCAYTNSSTGRKHYLLPWVGVACSPLHGRITALNLANMSLSGPLPAASIARLKFLQVLNLSSNSFHGTFPADLANCTHLRIMDFSASSELGGSIPREWGRLRHLEILVVADNALSGSVPVELANCSELVWLFLSNTELLSGSIPVELGGLGKLKGLVLRGLPGLTGNIPASLANCSALTEFSLVGSRVRGNIPAQLGRLAQLQELLVFNNFLYNGAHSSSVGKLQPSKFTRSRPE